MAPEEEEQQAQMDVDVVEAVEEAPSSSSDGDEDNGGLLVVSESVPDWEAAEVTARKAQQIKLKDLFAPKEDEGAFFSAMLPNRLTD